MKTHRSIRPSLRQALLVSIALAAPLPLSVHAQAPATLASATASTPGARAGATHMADGLALERRGDAVGALAEFRESAESGHGPAQRRLGEIYATGNSAVKRDFQTSTQWYGKARASGEQIPEPRSRSYGNGSPSMR